MVCAVTVRSKSDLNKGDAAQVCKKTSLQRHAGNNGYAGWENMWYRALTVALGSKSAAKAW